MKTLILALSMVLALNSYAYESAQDILEKTDNLKSWHGKEYGHRSDDLLKVNELCF